MVHALATPSRCRRIVTFRGTCELKLLSLYASNFKKLKLKQQLFFPEGIIVITGLNESGKSTVLDAILYALFGRMIRPNQKPSNEDIISYGSGETQVRLEFAIGENRYRVVREIHKTRPNEARLYEVKLDGASKTIATTVHDTTAEIERLLGGITYNEIVASSVVAQKDLERLIKQRPDDRRKVINVFLNLDSFNKVQDELDDERVRLEGTSRTPGQLTMERQLMESLSQAKGEYEEKQAQVSTLAEKAEKLKIELKDLRRKFEDTDQLYRTLNEYEEAFDRQESLKKELEGKSELGNNLSRQLANTSSLRTELSEVRRQLAAFGDLAEAEALLADVSKQFEAFRESELFINQLLDRQKQRKTDIAQKKRELPRTGQEPRPKESSMVWAYLAATGALGAGAVLSFFLSLLVVAVVLGSVAVVSLVLLSRQIASLSRAAEASKEQQRAQAGFEVVDSWEKELADIEKNISLQKGKISDDSSNLLVLARSIPRFSTTLADVRDPKDALERAVALFQNDKQSRDIMEERARLLERQLEQEPEILKQLEETKEEAKSISAKISSVNLPSLPQGIVFSENLLVEAAGFRDSLNESVSRVKTQIEETIARRLEVKTYLEENQNLEEKVDGQQRKVGLLEKDLVTVKYSIKGLELTSESLRNRVKPRVERYMGLILPVITAGRYKAVELDDDYTVRVFDPDAGEFKPKEVFSGGTEDQLLLAMRLAFALALIPQAKGQSPEFLFLDEPLGSSDSIRREGILTLLRNELSQNFRQIFLISHVGDLEADADTIIEMENGTVREVTGRKSSLQEPVQVAA